MHDFISFLWVSLHDYFLVWVSGGGFVLGIIFVVIPLVERFTAIVVPKSLYAGVLLALLVVFATFSAWHGSQTTLRSVEAQAALDVAHLNECFSDLRVARSKNDDFQDNLNSLGKQISQSHGLALGQQANLNGAQASANQCFATLQKVTAPLSLVVSSHSLLVKDQPSNTNVGILVADTNKRIAAFRGSISCLQGFFVNQVEMIQGMQSLSPSYSQVQGQLKLDLDFSGSAWDVGQPIVIILHGTSSLDVSRCSVSPR